MRHTSVPRRCGCHQKRLAQAEKRIGELDRLFIRIYEDNVAGRLDDERFTMMSKNYTVEQKDLKAEVKNLQQQIHEQEQQAENIEQFVQRGKEERHPHRADPYALRELRVSIRFRFHFRQLASASAAWYAKINPYSAHTEWASAPPRRPGHSRTRSVIMELQLAYCDDEALVGQIFIPKVQAEFQRQGVRAHVSLVSSPKRLLSLVESGKTFDAYFLDIDMPQLDGITLGRHLRERAPNAAIIFLSNKEEMVYSVFRVKPLRFLRKNRFEAEIADAVQAVLLSLREVERKTVIFEDGNQVYRFSPREILFVEILNRTLIVVRARDSIRLRATITTAEELLVPFGFIRIHKSYLVNYRAIFTIGKKDVLLEDGRALPISKHRYREVLQQFMQLHRKEDEEVES